MYCIYSIYKFLYNIHTLLYDIFIYLFISNAIKMYETHIHCCWYGSFLGAMVALLQKKML